MPQKRKDPPPPSPARDSSKAQEQEGDDALSESTGTDAATLQGASPTDEYGSGRIVCETCGEAVSIRDEANGSFTVKHWEAHRGAW